MLLQIADNVLPQIDVTLVDVLRNHPRRGKLAEQDVGTQPDADLRREAVALRPTPPSTEALFHAY